MTIKIIDNFLPENDFKEIKDFLINKGYNFYSETDTEVIANLIEFYLIM